MFFIALFFGTSLCWPNIVSLLFALAFLFLRCCPLNPLPPCQSLQFVLSLFAHIFTSEIGRILKWLFCKMKRTTIENNWRWDQWLPCERFLKIGFSLWHGFLLLLLLAFKHNTWGVGSPPWRRAIHPIGGGGFSISSARKSKSNCNKKLFIYLNIKFVSDLGKRCCSLPDVFLSHSVETRIERLENTKSFATQLKCNPFHMRFAEQKIFICPPDIKLDRQAHESDWWCWKLN